MKALIMGYTFRERQRIHRKAKQKIGVEVEHKQDAPEDWMDNCIESVIDDGEAENEDDAEAMCEMIWEDQ
jgi:hypothetical protein